MHFSRRVLLSCSVLPGAIVLAVLFRNQILWQMGAMLVNTEAPRKADMVVVLAGDYRGNRILKGAELVREGFAPKLFISNGEQFYGLDESDAAIQFAVAHGFSRDNVISFHGLPNSTNDEARLVPARLREIGVHTILLVTSPSHTARATRLFRKFAPDIDVHPVAAPDPRWCRGYWWTQRECEKTWFFEEVKTVTGFFDI